MSMNKNCSFIKFNSELNISSEYFKMMIANFNIPKTEPENLEEFFRKYIIKLYYVSVNFLNQLIQGFNFN